jgi:hypothetical protein
LHASDPAIVEVSAGIYQREVAVLGMAIQRQQQVPP